MEAKAQTGTQTSGSALRRWIVEHEDRSSFLFLYIAAAVVLSLVISLFWLVFVVALHLFFELVRFSTHEDRPARVLQEALWEVKLDVALILVALTLAVYIDAMFGVLGLSTAARAAGASARFLALERAVRGILISLDDALLVVRGVLKKMAGRSGTARLAADEKAEAPTGPGRANERPRPSHSHGNEGGDRPSWRGRWKPLDWTTFAIVALCLALFAAVPSLTGHDHSSALQAMAEELHPWPSDSPLQGMIDRSMAWLRS